MDKEKPKKIRKPKKPKPKPVYLSFKEKLCYGAGDISNGLAVASIGIWLLKYLTDVAGISPAAAGYAIVIGRVWDALTDPLMGWITDQTKSRWGKRRPYLLFGAFPYALSFFCLWIVPEFGGDQIRMFAYITIVMLIFNTSLTVVFVPYTSLTAAITNDYNERTSLTGFRMTCSQLAFLVGAALPSALVAWVISEDGISFLNSLGIQSLFGTWAGTERQGFFIMAGLFSIVIIGSILTTFFGTKEKDFKKNPKVASENIAFTPFDYATKIIDELLGNHPFRISVLILLVTNCATTFVAVILPYYLQYAINVHHAQTTIFLLLFVTAIISVPFWVTVAKRYGKAETYRVAMAAYILVLFTLPFVQYGQVKVMYLISIAAGFFHAAAMTLPWAIVPDVVEHDELIKGKRREGLFYGGTTFTYKLATALPVFLYSSFLSFIGYVPNQEQTQSVITGIKSIIGPVPAMFLALGIILAFKYPLNAEKHALLVKELMIRNENEDGEEE